MLVGETRAFHKRHDKPPGRFRESLDHVRGRLRVYHWAMVHENLWPQHPQGLTWPSYITRPKGIAEVDPQLLGELRWICDQRRRIVTPANTRLRTVFCCKTRWCDGGAENPALPNVCRVNLSVGHAGDRRSASVSLDGGEISVPPKGRFLRIANPAPGHSPPNHGNSQWYAV